jgi:hypothetical protein
MDRLNFIVWTSGGILAGVAGKRHCHQLEMKEAAKCGGLSYIFIVTTKLSQAAMAPIPTWLPK